MEQISFRLTCEYWIAMNYSLSSIVEKRVSRMGRILMSAVTLVWLASGAAMAESTVVVDEVVKQALNATPDLDSGRQLYYNCALCHTPEGWGSPAGNYPQIAGQHQSVIIKQLADIHKGNRDNPTMMPFTKPLFDKGPQALADVSAYIEKLPMVPNNSIGTGMRLNKGKALYNEHCKSCHSENGEGRAADYYPRIHGQHFRYLLRQLQWIKMGKRRNADPDMVQEFKKFSQSDLAALADYVSRLKPEKGMLADHSDWRNPDFRPGFRTAPRQGQEMGQ
jgi:cytochrome c553